MASWQLLGCESKGNPQLLHPLGLPTSPGFASGKFFIALKHLLLGELGQNFLYQPGCFWTEHLGFSAFSSAFLLNRGVVRAARTWMPQRISVVPTPSGKSPTLGRESRLFFFFFPGLYNYLFCVFFLVFFWFSHQK